ncbi:MAG TPA: metallophosphoesterase, partial [Salinarimonas sp.]|nr:metallophosphoesterase [Salinarimonas sp.]
MREGRRPKGLTGSGSGAIQSAAEEAFREGEFDSEKAFISAAHQMPPEYEPDWWGLYRPARYQQPVPLSVVQPAITPVPQEPSGRAQRILAIGDLHQDPRFPDRLPIMTWLGRLASEHRPERIIQIGDWSTNDSVNQHEDNSTEAARYKPKIRDDLDNLLQTHQYFRRGIAEDYRPKLDIVLGNHEQRLERFENANPEAVGTYTLARDETFAQFGWRTRPYGELFYVEGVGFTHHPTNGAGRAFGGKTGPQRAANESTVPVVSGHTHRRQVHDSPKIGPVDVISMVEIGCGLPWGTVESYA